LKTVAANLEEERWQIFENRIAQFIRTDIMPGIQEMKGIIVKYYILCCAVTCILIVTACSDEAVPPSGKSELELARERWDSQGCDSYEITQRRDCYCLLGGRPVQLLVWRDSLLSGVDMTDSTAIAVEPLKWYKTVDQLFDFIATIDPAKVAHYEARFDTTYGYPTYFYVDYDVQIADEEIGYECSDLNPLR
jgi:hypothetical protein